MNEQRIESALRAGPPDEPAYPGRSLEPGSGVRLGSPRTAVATRRGGGIAFLPAFLAACLLIGVAFVAWRLSPSAELGSAAESSSPSRAASPGSEVTLAPTGLVDRWVGSVRTVWGNGQPGTRAALDIRGAELRFDGGPGVGVIFPSALTWRAPDVLELTATTHAGGCEPYDRGTYRWSLSPGGTSLTLSIVADDCPARAGVVPGVWTHTACREATNDCLGSLEPGAYASTEFDPLGDGRSGQLTYTVPDGWANTLDRATSYFLRPTVDYLSDAGSDGNDGVHGIYVQAGTIATTQPDDCTSVDDPSVAHTAQAIAAHLLTLPGIQATDLGTLDIGGKEGWMVDVEIDPAWTGACPWSGGLPFRSLIAWSDLPPGDGVWGANSGSRQRVVLLDAAPGRVVSIWIDTTGERFDALAVDAIPIISSMRFAGSSSLSSLAPSLAPSPVPTPSP